MANIRRTRDPFPCLPMKLGNADGGKASYQLSPLTGTHFLHTEVGIINGNKTTKDSRISKIGF